MNPMLHWSVVATLLAFSLTSLAAELDGMTPKDVEQVAGRNLHLNGAGLGKRFVIKVYAISLYLLEPKANAEDIVNSDDPRRIAIVMLRDVDSREFSQAITDALTDSAGASAAMERVMDDLADVGRAITTQYQGLRKGDRLTMDWVPGLGAVIELNQRRLTRPHDRAFYKAMSNVWLGAKPVDPKLRARLLGSAPA